MYYLKITDPEGVYVNESGERFSISEVRRVRTPKGVNVGYEEYSSLKEALVAWGLRDDSGELLSTRA